MYQPPSRHLPPSAIPKSYYIIMSHYSLFTTSSHMVIQGDVYAVDSSWNTTNNNTIETAADRNIADQPPPLGK
ncbi:hypothetical protein BYT27DRAFT_6808209 [Phlegmacium glaucopus]|nr:hypothetical protein BYT27DRAFT_6808209 [Phlegmacium glaucopus]